MSVAGVRGAITLAGILTLPLFLTDGSLFPARDLVIFLAAGVIILSLVVASIALPRLLRNIEVPVEASHRKEEDYARIAAAEAAIMAVERAQHDLAAGRPDADLYADVATQIMELYPSVSMAGCVSARSASRQRKLTKSRRYCSRRH